MNNQDQRQSLKELAKPIFERRYMVGIRFKDTLSIEEIKAYGMPTTGDARIDYQVHNDMVDRYITINDMVEYFKAGTAFSVRNSCETKEIYDVIDSYLNGWKNFLAYSVNTQAAPVEDLVALDRLAAKVYDHAVEHFKEDSFVSSFEKILGSSAVERNVYRGEQKPVNSSEDDRRPENINRHTPNADYFSSKIYKTRR